MARAVFGGPPPDAPILKQAFKANRLDWPVLVVAIHQWRPKRTAELPGIRLLQLHPGLTYLLTNRPGLALRRRLTSLKLMHSSIETAASPAQLFHAIQQSILSLRRQELHRLEQKDQPADLRQRARQGQPSWQSEIDLQHLLTDQIHRHDPNWTSTAKVWVQLVLHRNPDHLNEVRRKIAQFMADLCGVVDQSPVLSYTYANAMEQLYRTHAYSDFPNVVLSILGDMQLHLQGLGIVQKHQPASVVQAMAYIRAQFHTPISLRDVAEHVGVSAPHLARQFKAGTGQSVSAWLHRLRVIHARQLLTETQGTVLEIAMDSGFGAVEHFHRVFKMLTGQTPHRYRQMHQHSSHDQNKS